jgi:hypothetical protein
MAVFPEEEGFPSSQTFLPFTTLGVVSQITSQEFLEILRVS